MNLLITRLQDRRDLNLRTASLHPDALARMFAENRAKAYENAIQDARELVKQARDIRAVLRVT